MRNLTASLLTITCLHCSREDCNVILCFNPQTVRSVSVSKFVQLPTPLLFGPIIRGKFLSIVSSTQYLDLFVLKN